VAGLRFTPLAFLLSGFGWLLLASLLGIATLLGLVYGTPLPKWLRTAHVHGTLVGGLLQLLIGGLLAAMAQLSSDKQAYHRSHGALYFLFNVGTLTLLAGLGYGWLPLAGAAGLLLAGTLLSVARRAGTKDWAGLIGAPQPAWLYKLSLATLFAGLFIGIGLAFQWVTEYAAHARLLHLHLILLGGVSVLFVVLTHRLFPSVVRKELAIPLVTRHTALLLLLGFVALLAGFVTSSLRLELAAGGLLVLVVVAYTVNLLRTWIAAGCPGSAASDHFLLAALFLALTTILGTLMGANYLSDPPAFPMGSLHVIGYTHVALIGFLVHSIFGALSYGLPAYLSSAQVPNPKKRVPYRERLESIMNRWRFVQLIGISFGTMGIGVLAAWTWSVPLGSPQVQITCWVSICLLVTGMGAVAAKLAWVTGLRPAE